MGNTSLTYATLLSLISAIIPYYLKKNIYIKGVAIYRSISKPEMKPGHTQHPSCTNNHVVGMEQWKHGKQEGHDTFAVKVQPQYLKSATWAHSFLWTLANAFSKMIFSESIAWADPDSLAVIEKESPTVPFWVKIPAAQSQFAQWNSAPYTNHHCNISKVTGKTILEL